MGEHTFGSGDEWDVGEPVSAMGRVVEFDELVAGGRLMRLGAVGEMDRSQEYARDGYTSVSAFLIHRCAMSVGEANREVFLARSLPVMPYAVKSVLAGRMGVSQLEVLAHARSRHPDQFGEDEPTLVEAVSGLTLDETRRAVDYWSQAHDHPDPAEEGEAAKPSRVWLGKTWQGRWRLDGDLDPVAGETLNSALDELMSDIVDATPKQELEAAPVRRGEALGEMARRFLDSPTAPTDHGNRPHVTVVIDWDTLRGAKPGGVSEFIDGTVITPSTAQQLACDARVCRLLTGPHSEILDLGRTQRTITPAQYRALRIRDRHCQWWGCRRPAPWCDGHHIRFWDQHDGPTDLNNLVLLCRHHHTLIHRHRWKLTGTPGNLTITRPNGTILNHSPP